MRASPRLVTTLLLSAALPLALAPNALAAREDRTPVDLGPTAETATGGGGGGGIARTIVGLAVVIAVIYGLSWVLKQVKASKEGSASGAGLHSMASLPLGTHGSVHLVRVGSEVVLLGAGERGVAPLRTYGEHEARAAGLLLDADDEPPVLDAPARPAGLLPAGPTPARLPVLATSVLGALRERTVRR